MSGARTSTQEVGRRVYVANAGTASRSGGTNYTGFTLNRGGHLRPLAGSTVTLPDASQPGDVLFSPDGSKLVGTRVATSLIDSFTVGRDGRLAAAPGSPFAAQGLGPFGSEFRPTNAAQLYVSNAHNVGAGTGTVSAFAVGADRADDAPTTIGASPFPNNQTAPCWVEISHGGRHLFAVHTASGSISSYSIATGGSLTLLGSTPISGAATPEDARLSPTAPRRGSSTRPPTPSVASPSGPAASPNCRPRPRRLPSEPHPPA